MSKEYKPENTVIGYLKSVGSVTYITLSSGGKYFPQEEVTQDVAKLEGYLNTANERNKDKPERKEVVGIVDSPTARVYLHDDGTFGGCFKCNPPKPISGTWVNQ